MVDTFTKTKRSEVMARVKSQDSALELQVRRAIHAAGFRYRLHAGGLPGKPDLVLSRYRTVIFVHGCFWHGHDCARGSRIPKSNTDYWIEKIERNRQRDQYTDTQLASRGWFVEVIWECSADHDLVRTLQTLKVARRYAAEPQGRVDTPSGGA